MASAQDSALQLAQRLRGLRKQRWPRKRITQEQLGEAFGVSVPLISSWERSTEPVAPPLHRLDAYATFFATGRSVERRPFRLLSQLTDDEQKAKDALLAELTELRDKAQGESVAAVTTPFGDNLWRFPLKEDITIVCSGLPERRLQLLPGADPDDPDYVELYQYSDLDSLLELHGHIRALNPFNNVHVRLGSSALAPDEYSSHLVLLGGVDWNKVTEDLLKRIHLPIRQLARDDDEDEGGFELVDGEEVIETFQPVLRESEGRQVLMEDIAHFYRSRNPFNRERTITMCNGTHSRGVLGAVRALTDIRFRDRNNDFAQSRLAELETLSILSRVEVLPKGQVATPDWTRSEFLLHEWAV